MDKVVGLGDGGERIKIVFYKYKFEKSWIVVKSIEVDCMSSIPGLDGV